MIGCEDSTDPSISPQQPTILGTWNWIESVGGGTINTPDSMGFTVQYSFSPDSIFTYYQDYVVGGSSAYFVKKDLAIGFSDSIDVVSLETIRGSWLPQWGAEYIGRDTLVLTTLGIHYVRSRYHRIM